MATLRYLLDGRTSRFFLAHDAKFLPQCVLLRRERHVPESSFIEGNQQVLSKSG